jgi:hypothetical protein
MILQMNIALLVTPPAMNVLDLLRLNAHHVLYCSSLIQITNVLPAVLQANMEILLIENVWLVILIAMCV